MTTPPLDNRRTCTWTGDARSSLGLVMGPNALRELLIVDEVEYIPPDAAHPRGVTRAWFRYAQQPEAGDPTRLAHRRPLTELPSWLVGDIGYTDVTCSRCGAPHRWRGPLPPVAEGQARFVVCPDCQAQVEAATARPRKRNR
jgi:hypothetical protein